MSEQAARADASGGRDAGHDDDEGGKQVLDLVGYDADPLSERLGELMALMSDALTPDEALAAADEVLVIYHRLSDLTPAALQDLAGLLTGVGSTLAAVSWRLALGPAEQAVAMYRDLLGAGFTPRADLSNELSKLLVFLSEMSTCGTDGLARVAQAAAR